MYNTWQSCYLVCAQVKNSVLGTFTVLQVCSRLPTVTRMQSSKTFDQSQGTGRCAGVSQSQRGFKQ